MGSTEDLDYPQIIFQYTNGFLVSKVLFTACELGVFDLLLESGEPLSPDAIAARLGTSPSGMERLLDACVGLKLLAVEKEETNMKESSKDAFQTLCRSEEEMLKFMAGQNAIWSICGRDVLAAFDLSPFRHIYDLGGGGGALAQECVSVYPNSTVTIYDLPKVVQVAKEWFVPSEERRITFHEGGGVLLVKSLLNEDKSRPILSHLYSVHMLVQTEGKERTPAEYSNLLQAAGFTEIQVKRIGNFYDAILGRK
ncbi:acetylserotonin O-methyltransferase-like [Apteryx mantelli]|uniref:Acetylserotonin O-methyltransferase n=1 Tax=Apteryx mantelli TaxID=2696672 RepID=A0ABM4G1E3_9AVES